jgi:hypothetical protein
MAPKTISVTIQIIPTISQETIREMVEQVVSREITRRGIRITKHDTIEEALYHRKDCGSKDE